MNSTSLNDRPADRAIVGALGAPGTGSAACPRREGTAAARDALLKGNPDAARQVGLFRDELQRGRWTYPARYKFDLPQPSSLTR